MKYLLVAISGKRNKNGEYTTIQNIVDQSSKIFNSREEALEEVNSHANEYDDDTNWSLHVVELMDEIIPNPSCKPFCFKQVSFGSVRK